jgi:hypothetical protein
VASLLDQICLGELEPRQKPKLPPAGSNLLVTLKALVELVEADSGQITQRLAGTNGITRAKEVASYLYVLKAKGFVQQTTARKRMAGGSLWTVTAQAQELLKE